YRKQLKQLGAESSDGKNGARLALWSALGDLCWEKLGERESAIAALEVAAALDPHGLERHKRLADLYVQTGPEHFLRSLFAHPRVLREEKGRVHSYRALKHLYIQTAQREKSLYCSYALELLHHGEPDDVRKVAELKRRVFATGKRPISVESWAQLTHPDEDRV